jgi:hypothetical protein
VTVESDEEGAFRAALACDDGDEITITLEDDDKVIRTVTCE